MKIKPIHKNFKCPVYSTLGAAAFDIHAPEKFSIDNGLPTRVKLGFAMEVPSGHVALLLPRSGLGTKYSMRLANTSGVIDSDYRGELIAVITADADLTFEAGDRILQCMIVPVVQQDFIIVDELSETDRLGGLGSTGI